MYFSLVKKSVVFDNYVTNGLGYKMCITMKLKVTG